MTFQYTDNDRDRFSLHDCRAQHIQLENDILTFTFPDGIWCEQYGQDWPNTGKAAVSFHVDQMRGTVLFVFHDENKKTIRTDYTLDELIRKVNAGEWELEFGYRYDGYQEILYRGWIWENHEPWTYECQLFIGTKEEAEYLWNDPE
ncbi:MAG: hypothetical protein K6A40_13220 [Solobacterium sp.]|nr:hypothetical protein [Solobacterium sp.]